jgi:hypothetical protein
MKLISDSNISDFLSKCPKELTNFFKNQITESYIYEDEYESLNIEEALGLVYIVETLEDLHQVPNKDFNIFTKLFIYDSYHYIKPYHFLFLSINESGGPAYLIPEQFEAYAPVLIELRVKFKYEESL